MMSHSQAVMLILWHTFALRSSWTNNGCNCNVFIWMYTQRSVRAARLSSTSLHYFSSKQLVVRRRYVLYCLRLLKSTETRTTEAGAGVFWKENVRKDLISACSSMTMMTDARCTDCTRCDKKTMRCRGGLLFSTITYHLPQTRSFTCSGDCVEPSHVKGNAAPSTRRCVFFLHEMATIAVAIDLRALLSQLLPVRNSHKWKCTRAMELLWHIRTKIIIPKSQFRSLTIPYDPCEWVVKCAKSTERNLYDKTLFSQLTFVKTINVALFWAEYAFVWYVNQCRGFFAAPNRLFPPPLCVAVRTRTHWYCASALPRPRK